MPSDRDGIMKWVTSFWSIWFSHELLPQHKQVLMDALSHLLEWSQSSDSWSVDASNPLRKLVNFVTPSTLAELRRMWQVWYNDDRPVEEIRVARKEFLNETEAEEYHHCTETHLVRCFGTFKFQKLSSTDKKCMEDSVCLLTNPEWQIAPFLKRLMVHTIHIMYIHTDAFLMRFVFPQNMLRNLVIQF